MSGWGPADWTRILFAALVLYGGITGLLRRPEPGTGWWSWDRFITCFMPVAWGLLILLDPKSFPRESWAPIAMGSLLLALALWVLLGEPALEARRLRARSREHEAALASLTAHADSYSPASYETELRALQADMPVPTSTRRRFIGVASLTFFGGTFLALGLAYPR